ncbi:flagellar export chaperone FliS [Alteromonas sediminis]|uniref:Flagellar secretion chaperone FliS n=1 Tax=Alteromonas sediminis TaxID=2259342 RepID=A0A3N5XW17_9ALTE|nr:flagellar export chaperone FliS [Alteromonas sediminis]RPJ64967.1 flagellar export chaperone FliS [Alteromonas sediminis]
MALKGINAYKKGNLKQDVSTADPHRLTLMLMQGALDRLAYAKGAMERREYEAKSEYLSKATAIVMHLRDTLDIEIGGEMAQNMYALYDYMVELITTANAKNSLQSIDEVISLLTPIRDAWVQIPESAKQEAFEAQRQKHAAV